MQVFEMVAVIVTVSTGTSVLKSYLQYKQKALEVKSQKAVEPDSTLRAEMAEVKQKLNELRDVTTQYDMSFDSALHRVESRLSHMEQRIQSVEEKTNAVQASGVN